MLSPPPMKYEDRPPQASNSRPHIDLKSETDSVCMTVTECEASGEHLSVCSPSVSTFSEDATVTAAPPGRDRAPHMVRALDGTAESTR